MVTVRERLRPAALPAEREAACFGLISDTHLPDRLAALPEAVFEVFDGVNLILHAGDVGVLAVLDQLSRAAPVVAVHGNDERHAETPRELPFQQVIACAGQRIVLTHSHHPDPAQEQAARADDRWESKLAHRATIGRRADAPIVIYGHTHIPTAVQHEGVWLINPGAIASGGLSTRQTCRTVALLYLGDDGTPFTVHVDLDEPQRAYVPDIAWEAGFRAAAQHYERSLLAEPLLGEWAHLQARVQASGPQRAAAFRQSFARLAHRCWANEQAEITHEHLRRALAEDGHLSAAQREALLGILAGSK